MKTFEHKTGFTKIGENPNKIVELNIFNFEKTRFNDLGHCTEGVLNIEFLGEKPSIGDDISSITYFGQGNVFKIAEILEKRDSRVEKPFDGKDAYHSLRVILNQ
jgi:hypothetical protein